MRKSSCLLKNIRHCCIIMKLIFEGLNGDTYCKFCKSSIKIYKKAAIRSSKPRKKVAQKEKAKKEIKKREKKY